MQRGLLIFFSLFLALVGWGTAAAEDAFYVIPSFKSNYAPVPKTGQTQSYSPGDDGDLEKGVAWPSPRFHDNGNGTVTDRLTGLIWTKNTHCFSSRTWNQALNDAAALADGLCGLTDGSKPGDWRLPNLKELDSLIDFANWFPCLPVGHPFSGTSYYRWSSNSSSQYAYVVDFDNGTQQMILKDQVASGWCVRGGP